MSNSSLVVYRDMTSGHWNDRAGNKISRIVIHHQAGNLSLQTLGNVFKNRQASAHYGIDSNGRIGQYVDEAYRAWTTSGWEPDRNTVTIEVANSQAGGNWPISDAAMSSLIKLCADICKRNGISRLYYNGKNGTLLRHCDYSATSCPGPYIKEHTNYICDQVNALLGTGSAASTQPNAATGSIDDLAKRTIAGEFGNGDQRRAALGANYNAVQARVNEILGGGSSSQPAVFDVDAAARDVIAGKYGNGDQRRTALGSHYDEVQARVNQMLGAAASTSVNIDAEARKVIRGDYGNGGERRNALVAKFGANVANQIQTRVNDLLR
ncbi:N-acetylmuramoyl-L-alanine amidase [Anaerolactibacter massiliensis]|uniref:N-acetylmuramoyl-L-alanine amidase n=1 Tax=Anaerolactibacter massiliensis TaxID=2044573 RepID=UPI000CF9DF94|nr:N-acetylmuramoyl-L-alanine amidase [Anaerolactibacter massiliensis]